MTDEADTENLLCQDPDCGNWVHIKLPISVSLIGCIAEGLPKGTDWVYSGTPALLHDHANLHVPHGWVPSYDDDPDVDLEGGIHGD